MTEPVEVAVVGAGQAGLALSHELGTAGIDHVVVERDHIGQSWRTRWDSFCLVTPNWTVDLPGMPFDGDVDGFMPRDDIVAHLERYARSFGAPVREGVEVTAIEARSTGGFSVGTSNGTLDAAAVVMANGAYQKAHRPAVAATLPRGIYALDAEDYRNPDALPEGGVLIVGSGQTGCQIAEELYDSGRTVHLACGRAPWMPRRIEGRDLVTWALESSFLDQAAAALPSPAARLVANFQASGRDGGHDLHYRTLADAGVTLTGRLAGFDERNAYFEDDLEASVAFGDARRQELCALIRKSCEARGVTPPHIPDPPPFSATAPRKLNLSDIQSVIFTSGFRPNYSSWLPFPDAFDEWGFPIQTDGESASVAGLFFMGTHFLRKRKSATFMGVSEDATVVAERVDRYVKQA